MSDTGKEKIRVKYDSIENETEKAVLFSISDEEIWLPKSQIKIEKEDHVVWVPRWLADKNNLDEMDD